MKTAEQRVVELGHSQDKRLPAAERIELYRALASTTAKVELAAHFFSCADDLEAAEQKIGQRTFDFAAGAQS